ncbi:hypothetical protein MOSE0_H06326 [Monosporozyma servazzii]
MLWGFAFNYGTATNFTPDIRVDDNDRDEKLSLDNNVKELTKELGRVICNLQPDTNERKEKVELWNS